jgi:hypothetical protein
MTKDVLIGTVTGVSAVLAIAVLRAQPPTASGVPESPVRASIDGGSGRANLPTTQPDPARVRLERTLERVSAQATPLEKVMQMLRDQTGVNLFVNWRALEAAGINREAPVTLDLHGVSAAVALRMALKDVGGGNVLLRFDVDEGVVIVSTADDLAKSACTRVYNVRDLIEEEFEHRRRLAGDAQKPVDEQQVVDALVRVIQETVDPTSWRDAGGSVGAVRYFGGRLIVTQTQDGHQEVVDLLAGLRATAAKEQQER